jgi:hypothetical protein
MLRFLENHDETRINSEGFAAHNIWSTIPAMIITSTLHGGPFMIYFGQEFGEMSNEIEGFNDAKDRTSMYDFWRVDTHQRWLNQGQFNYELLSNQEIALDQFYQQLFMFVKDSNAVQFGHFFDLQYAQDESYPCQFVYAYLRHLPDEQLLFINNFHPTEILRFSLRIPELAIELMGSKDFVWEIHQAFIPPQTFLEPPKNFVQKEILISPNSTYIFKAI